MSLFEEISIFLPINAFVSVLAKLSDKNSSLDAQDKNILFFMTLINTLHKYRDSFHMREKF